MPACGGHPRVPYDCCLPMLFQGEEISIGIRAWTFGYDLYAPHTSVDGPRALHLHVSPSSSTSF